MSRFSPLFLVLLIAPVACGKKSKDRDPVPPPPVPTYPRPTGTPVPPGPLIVPNTQGRDFAGTVRLPGCSASLVRFDDAQDTAKALVLSNGHCLSFMDPGEVISGKPMKNDVILLNTAADDAGKVHIEIIVYATMTKTDLSFMQLTETYGEIRQKFGIEALTLSRQGPQEGDDIEVLSAYWKKPYICHVEKIVPELKEWHWSWQDSVRYSPECKVEHGSSGSPVLAPATRQVVAVNNTNNDQGLACDFDNPCEYDRDGVMSVMKNQGYAQQTAWLYSCRDAEGRLDLRQPGCLLPHAP